jgi:ArsR family transcriptional regulator
MVDGISDDPIRLLFVAFSNRTRLSILGQLSKQSLGAGDLAKALEISQRAVTHQLRFLEKAKLVERNGKGDKAIFCLADASSAVHADLLKCLPHCVPASRNERG